MFSYRNKVDPVLYTSKQNRGWYGGSYVYFLICAGDAEGVIFIKIGLSDNPTDRLRDLVNNCARPPLTFAWVHTYSRGISMKIEKELHRRFKEWRVKGEWFKFTLDEKDSVFKPIRSEVLSGWKTPDWPLELSVIDVNRFLSEGTELAKKERIANQLKHFDWFLDRVRQNKF